jgi:hypothetical protein
MNYDYMFRLKLAIIRSIPHIYNSKYTERKAFKRKIHLTVCSTNMFTLAPIRLTKVFVHKYNNNNNNNNNKSKCKFHPKTGHEVSEDK